MKPIFLILSVLTFNSFAADAPSGTPAPAEEILYKAENKSLPEKIGTVSMKKAVETSEQGIFIQGRLQTIYNEKKKSLQAEEAAIKNQQTLLQTNDASYTDAQKAEKHQALTDRMAKYQTTIENAQAEMQKTVNELTEPVIADIKKTIKEIAVKRSYTVVKQSASGAADTDLTDEVITAYNQSSNKPKAKAKVK